jgi:hypothetical protein
MAKMTEEEADALDEELTRTTPKEEDQEMVKSSTFTNLAFFPFLFFISYLLFLSP